MMKLIEESAEFSAVQWLNKQERADYRRAWRSYIDGYALDQRRMRIERARIDSLERRALDRYARGIAPID